MNLLEKFTSYHKDRMAMMQQTMFLLTVSGGVDSVVLCDLFYKLGFKFFIAHCNFQLRGAESDRDEQFVKSLGEKYDRKVLIKRFETSAYVTEKKVSVQVAARDLRYDWFRSLLYGEEGAKQIVTAHHADDNIETIVMNFFRGTGLQGLIGMDANYSLLFRPLLPFRKEEILSYAQENNLAFVEDSSNAHNDYTRNYFRNELLPSVQKVFPEAERNILKNIERLRQVQQVYEQAMKEYKSKLIETVGKEEHIPILKLKKQLSFRTILWEILKERGFTSGQLNEVIKLMDATNGSYIDSGSYRIIKNRKWLVIAHINLEELNGIIVIDSHANKVSFSDKKLTIESISTPSFQIPASPNIACIAAKDITFPLILRKAKQGDYFYPLGMKKKKKVSRFLIDLKLSKTEKENVWVLETNKKIMWVVGYRIDDRFKIEPSTKEVLKDFIRCIILCIISVRQHDLIPALLSSVFEFLNYDAACNQTCIKLRIW